MAQENEFSPTNQQSHDETDTGQHGQPQAQAAAQIEALQQELAQMKDKWIRAVAETENLRKRSQREQEEAHKYGITAFARDMVDVLENLIRASGNITPEARLADPLYKQLGEGVDLTRDALLNIFEKYAITRIDPMGEKFDHNFHQAVVQVDNNEVESGTVLEVLQAGYVIHNRLLRPAMVAVSKRGDAKPEGGSVDTMA